MGRRAWLALALALPAPALACPPPPGPPEPRAGESDAAYRARLAALAAEDARALDASLLAQQTAAWDRAQVVTIARISRITAIGGGFYGGMHRADLVPVATLKGAAPRPFRLADTGMTDCGAIGGGDAPGGRAGDLIVVYLRSGRPGNRTMIQATAAAFIRDPRVRRALATPR